MTAVLTRLRSDLRRGWRSWLALSLLIGVFSGVVLGAAIGARRTSTAYSRFLRYSHAQDVLLSPAVTGVDSFYGVLAQHQDVDIVGAVGGAALFTLERGAPEYGTNVFMPLDGRFATDVDRPRMISGRQPRSDAPRELMANPQAAERYHLRPGSRIVMTGLAYPNNDTSAEPKPTRLRMTVVGIGAIAPDIVPTTKLDGAPTFITSPAFYKTYVPRTVSLSYDGAAVRLKPGVSPTAFRATAQQLASGFDEVGGELFVGEQTDRTRKVDRAIRPQAFALGGFAAFAGLASFLVLGQALTRQLTLDATEVPVLRTLGLTRFQLASIGILRAALVAVVAAVVAVGVAIAVSPVTPIGAARRAEVSPGVEVNVTWLGIGAVVIVALFVARAAPPSWRLARAKAGVRGTAELTGGERPSLLARLAGQATLPPPAGAGVRMALEPGRGRSAAPVRAALVGALIALAAVATAFTFAASLERLVGTPRLFGRTWDMTLDGQFAALPRAKVEQTLRESGIVRAATGGYYGEATIAGRGVTAIGLDGDVGPSLVEGRAPRAADEVVLGTSTMRRAGAGVGDTVRVVLGSSSSEITVVGRAVFPGMGRGGFPQTGLGEGVWTTAAALEPPPDPRAAGKPYFNFYLIRLRDGVTQAQRNALDAKLDALCGAECPYDDALVRQQPAEIATLDRVRWTPVLLAAVLAFLALATVGQTLVSSIRRRRRELALLKTLGFLRSQVSAAVAWQATTIALVAVVLGLPLGVVLGRLAWQALATQLGIVPEPATPLALLVIAVPVTVLLANLIAIVPGVMAARARPATALRAE